MRFSRRCRWHRVLLQPGTLTCPGVPSAWWKGKPRGSVPHDVATWQVVDDAGSVVAIASLKRVRLMLPFGQLLTPSDVEAGMVA